MKFILAGLKSLERKHRAIKKTSRESWVLKKHLYHAYLFLLKKLQNLQKHLNQKQAINSS